MTLISLKSLIKKTTSTKKRWSVFYWTMVLMLILAVQPLKNHAYREIMKAGNNALSNGNYSQAITDYQKLRLIKMSDAKAISLIKTARDGQKDVLTLRQFYIDQGNTKMIDLFDQTSQKSLTALTPPTALAVCQNIYNQNQPELALVCAQNLTTVWPQFRDGWALLETVAKAKNNADIAATAHQHALELDPNYGDQ
ncbi:MAG: hypothetical protein WC773_03670 [Patescibacteria group bacterium]|jgi:tetratricopeptide (TPR) repeat protein